MALASALETELGAGSEAVSEKALGGRLERVWELALERVWELALARVWGPALERV